MPLTRARRQLILRLGAPLLLSLAIAACGSPTGTSSQPPVAPEATRAPASVATAASAPTPTAAPAAKPAASPTTAPSPAASPAAASSPVAAAPSPAVAASPVAATAPAAGQVRLAIAEGTEARYKVREVLAGRTSESDVVGTTRDVTGQVVLAGNGSIVADQSKITVDLRTLRSDRGNRDQFIQRTPLETNRFPNAEFVPKEVRGLASPLPTSGESTFQLLGDLTVHGVTKPATWEVRAQFSEREVTGLASTPVTFADFNMSPPQVPSVLSIAPNLTLELDFKLTR